MNEIKPPLKKGDALVCENDHVVARLSCDIMPYSRRDAAQFCDWVVPPIRNGVFLTKEMCSCSCGAVFIRPNSDGFGFEARINGLWR